MSAPTPNPGSDEAVARGCTCPVLDNRRGEGLGRGLFWLSGDCPLHGEPPPAFTVRMPQ